MLLQMAGDGLLYEGALLQADAQTNGKGQRGNSWESEPLKNLTFSVLLKPSFLTPQQQFELNRVSSLAIMEAISPYLPHEEVTIKWPNDIYVNKLKLGGVLIENSLSKQAITQSIVGIGLNINQLLNLPKNATSIIASTGEVNELDQVLVNIAKQLERYYLQLKRGDNSTIHANYMQHLYLHQQEAKFEDSEGLFRGTITGVTAEGLLEIQKNTGKIKQYQFKEVVFKN